MMKKSIIILVFLGVISLFSHAQQQFYAIDGSEWLTEEDRDAREKSLWNEFNIYADYIRKQNLPEAELAETYSSMMDLFKELFISCREVNTGLKNIVEDNGVELELIKNKIKIDPSKANNKEVFYTQDLKEFFNIALDQFDFGTYQRYYIL